MALLVLKQKFAGDRLKRDLTTQIDRGLLKVGDAVLPERKLAEKYGIGYITVRKAVAELEKQGLLERYQGKGTFVRKGRTPLTAKEVVGVAIRTTGHYYERMSGYLIRGLMRHHMFPLVVDILEDRNAGYNRTKILIEKQPPFLVIEICEDPSKVFSLLKHYKGQVIFIYNADAFWEKPASYVLTDSRQGGMLAAEHLISLGYRRIIFYMHRPAPYQRAFILEEDGIGAALDKHGLSAKNFVHWEEGDEKALEERLKREKMPVAMIGYADFSLNPVYSVAKKLGLRIPEDIGLIGWHDTPHCGTVRPHLTSVSIREDLMAEKVIEVITNKALQGKKILIPPELVVRGSTRKGSI